MLKSKSSLVMLSVVSALFANGAFAGTCDVDVEATAAMAYNVKEIAVPKTCKEVTLNFKAAGTLPKAVMGHNVVITKTSDMQAVVADGSKAGAKENYVKPKDARVIANTIVIGGGESTSVKFKLSALKASEAYSFFCSFPGHSAVMKGVFKLV